MSSYSYLIASDLREPTPTLSLRKRQYEVIAEGVSLVPLLWLSLFRRSDLMSWTSLYDDGTEFECQNPVVSRRRISRRLLEAKAALTKVTVVEQQILHDLLNCLKMAIDAIKPSRRYLVCEWQEIGGLNRNQHERDTGWLLRFFGGAAVRSVDSKFETLCGRKLKRRFQNPVTTPADDFSDHSWKVLDALLGDTLSGDAPWHSQEESSSGYKNLWEAMHHHDEAALQRMLADGTPIDPGNVQTAASLYSVRCLELLLAFGGDVNESYLDYGTPLVKAFNSNARQAPIDDKIRLLLDHGANPNITGIEPETILCCCFAHGLKFASAIIGRCTKVTTRRFLRFAESEPGKQYARNHKIRWRQKFLSLIHQRLDR